ncbi:MAG: putative transcription regulator [uncultured bacterium]|nr:MAG: putative transcription regulator [uncultured bacterium]
MDNVNFLHRKDNLNDFEKKPKRSPKKWLILLLIPLFLALTVYGYSYSKKMSNTQNPLDYNENTLEPKKPEGILQKIAYLLFKPETKLEGAKDDRINILLLGMGGPGHDGPYLTDTIMIVSIKPSTNDVAFISIPRDLGITIGNYGFRKINSANAYGEMAQANWGGAYATQIISKEFGIEIPYYIRIDFKAFESIINEVGGVKVNVETSFTDYMYPGIYTYKTISFKKGEQTMDGETALEFSRSRHGNNGEGSDFARASRQQKIIQALKDKILSFNTLTNPVKIKNIMETLESHMTTNMQFDEILSFIRMAKEIQGENIKKLVLDNSVEGYLTNFVDSNGAFMLRPKTGNFNDINNTIKNIFTDETITQTETQVTNPEQENPNFDWASVEIQNGTWQAGLAARLKQRLLDEKFYVEDVGNIPVEFKPFSESVIYSFAPKNKDVSPVLQALAKELNMKIETNIPQGINPVASSTDIMVVLGDDFVE